MSKRVLDVGNCAPDHAAIRDLIESRFAAEVVQTHGTDDTIEALRQADYALVLVNRKLDRDYSDGLDIIKRIKSDPTLRSVPVMLVTNFPEHQALAVGAGAVEGFGKLSLEESATVEKLGAYLS